MVIGLVTTLMNQEWFDVKGSRLHLRPERYKNSFVKFPLPAKRTNVNSYSQENVLLC